MVLTMELGDKGYDIVVERGALRELARYMDTGRRALIVTDDGVPAALAGVVSAQFPRGTVVTVGMGEGAKSFPVFQMLCEKLLELHFTKSDVVVALGGGVIGDLAGFAAASFMRGIGFVNLPTTTLSQIDSSIGGKVAINLGGVKNCVGAFYQPELVVVDADTLSTLPERHRRNGLVEAVKAGLIGDSGLFGLFESEDPARCLDEIILRSLAVKKAIVEQDEREQGLRRLLNLGHTVGHGLEGVYGLDGGGALLHGEAVAVGLLPMIDGKELRERTAAALRRLGVNPAFPYDADRVYEVMTFDKKNRGGTISIVRVREPGEAYLKEIPVEELRGYLQ